MGWRIACSVVLLAMVSVAKFSQVAHAAPVACDPNHEVWVGLPYLNQYQVIQNGNCVTVIHDTFVGSGNTVGSSLLLGSSAWIQEAQIIIENGGSLTGNAASSITVNANVGITVLNGGSVNLSGTTVSPVTLSGTGAWGGIVFRQGSNGTLDHVTITNAGSGSITDNAGNPRQGALVIQSSTVSLTSSTIDHSFGDGVFVNAFAVPTLTSDQFTNNAGFAVNFTTVPGSLTTQLAGLTATGNGNCNSGAPCLPPAGPTDPSRNSIRITSGSSEGSWLGTTPGVGMTYPGVPLFFDGEFHIGGSHTFELGPGFQLRSLSPLYVENGSSLRLFGTGAQPVVLTSARPTPAAGDWGGVSFRQGSAGNWSNVVLSYAGNPSLRDNAGNPHQAGIIVQTSAVTITNSLFDRSAGDGVFVNAGATPTLTSIQFTNNAGFAVNFGEIPNTITNHLTSLNATGNGNCSLVGCLPPAGATGPSRNSIRFAGGNLFSSNQWTGATPGVGMTYPGLPFFFDGPTQIGGAARVELGPGFQVRSLTELAVNNGAALNLFGTAAQPVVLSSARPTPAIGDWGGVAFRPNGQGTWDHVKLRHAGSGSSTDHTGTPHRAAIVATQASPTITNSVIELSNGDDIYAQSATLPVIHGTIFGAVPATFFGVRNDGWTSGQPLVNATGNDWGSPTGPTIASNPGGTGVPVTTGVDYGNFGSRALAGTVALPGRTPGTTPYVVQLQVRFYAPGTTTLITGFPQTVATDNQGAFIVSGFDPGPYDVEVQLLNSLARKALNVTFAAVSTVHLNFGTLLPGNSDGNGVVDTADFSRLRNTFGTATTCATTAPASPCADFNGDGVVDIVDFSLQRSSFGQTTSLAEGVPTSAPPRTMSAPYVRS